MRLALRAAVATTMIAGFVAQVGTGADVAHALPSGFTDGLVAAVPAPTSVEQLPNGRVVVLEQDTGRVRLIDSRTGALLPAAALDLDVCAGGERGLLGFTHDPQIGRNRRVYLFYTRVAAGFPGGCVNRVSAFSMIGDTILADSEQVLIDNISSVNGNHNGGDLEVGNDGYLYVSTGDAGRDPRGDSGSGGANDAALDLSLLSGKVLRLDRFSGAPAPGNFLLAPGRGGVRCGSRGSLPQTPRTPCAEIFAYGLRNPYRFAFDPNTSGTRFFVNDTGQVTFEEVNRGIAGANYGWNRREGPCPQGQTPPCAGPPAGMTDPLTAYGRGLGQFITAGAFVPDGVWPGRFDGGYLFADGGTGRIWLRSRGGSVDYGRPFAEVPAGLADMTFVLEPDGYALWYTLNGSSQVRRIRATIAAQPSSGPQRLVAYSAPRRAFDSREQTPATPLAGGRTRLVDLGLPDGATAAMVNVTLVDPAGPAYATLWRPRTRRPATSNLNAPAGTVAANSAIVPVGPDGRVLVHVHDTTHLVIDVVGHFRAAPAAVTAGRLVTVEAARLLDTRQPRTATNAFERSALRRQPAVDLVEVPVGGRFGVPAGRAGAVVVIATAVNGRAGARGYASLFAGGTPIPSTSNVNLTGPGDRRANLALVPLGADGSISVKLHEVDDIVLDVVGWISNGSAASSTAGRFHLTAPTREADTRSGIGFGRLGPGQTRTLDPRSAPARAHAIAQNLTSAPSSAPGYLTAFAPSRRRPFVSNLNATAAGQVRAAMAITATGDRRVSYFSQNGTQLVVDAYGWFE